MAQTDHPLTNIVPPTERVAPSRTARIFWGLLILTTLYVCYFQNLGVVGLLGPDEPRYAWIARDMAESGDWVTPRLYGKTWFEKPVLYYWAAALSFKLFGVNEISARLPGALFALAATLALAWLAWRTYGEETARWLLLLLPTTVGMIGFSHAAATDMPFAATFTIAMIFAARLLGLVPARGLEVDSRSGLWGSASALISSTSFTPFFFGMCLGLAVLAKGPAGIVLAGGAVLLWATFTNEWRAAFRCLHPVGIAGFCLTALPWYILCARRNPDFFRIFIIEHNFKRYLTPEFQHVQPFWFYIPVIVVALLPWTLPLLWASEFGFLRRLRGPRFFPITTLLLTWAIFCLLFFSISKSKLPGYILPAIPAIGLLLAASCVHLAPENVRSFRWIRFGFLFLALPVAIALLWMRRYDPSSLQAQKMTSAAIILLLLGLTNLLLANRVSGNRILRQSAPLCVIPVFVILLGFHAFASPWFPTDPSAKSLAPFVAEVESQRGSEFFVQPKDRNLKFSLSFYLHREVEFWNPKSPKEGYLLFRPGATQDECNHYLGEGWSCSRRFMDFPGTGWMAYRIHRQQ